MSKKDRIFILRDLNVTELNYTDYFKEKFYTSNSLKCYSHSKQYGPHSCLIRRLEKKQRDFLRIRNRYEVSGRGKNTSAARLPV